MYHMHTFRSIRLVHSVGFRAAYLTSPWCYSNQCKSICGSCCAVSGKCYTIITHPRIINSPKSYISNYFKRAFQRVVISAAMALGIKIVMIAGNGRGKPTASSLSADGFPLMAGPNFQPSDGNPNVISILRQLADGLENVQEM